MSRENVEVVRRVHEATARHDSQATLALYDPEVEWDISQHPAAGLTAGSSIEDQIYRGHEGLRRLFRSRKEAFETIEDRIEELIDAGDQVISIGTTHARGRASGAEVKRINCQVWTIRNGKVVRVASFGTREDALRAAGLPE